MHNLSRQRPLSTTRISTLDASRSSTSQVKTTFIFGCLMIFLSFSGILILGHLLVAKRMYHIWHVSFWGRFRTEKMPETKHRHLASSIKVPTWPSDARVLKGKDFDHSNVTGQRSRQIYGKRYCHILNILSIRQNLSIDLFSYITISCHKSAITGGSIHSLQLTIRTTAEHKHLNFPNIVTELLDIGKQIDPNRREHKAGGWPAWTWKLVDFS